MMTPHERIECELSYFQQRARESRLKIELHVASSGAIFRIEDPSTGRELHRSPPAETQSFIEFQRALDRAITSALL
jgi:hypothetical protein